MAAYAPTNELMGTQLSYCINFAPQHHYVLQAAIARPEHWVRTGEPAADRTADRPDRGDPPELVLDANGLAKAASAPRGSTCRSRGRRASQPTRAPCRSCSARVSRSTPRPCRRLYPGGSAEYLERFTEALDRAIDSGFIVPADRAEILELAAATFPN